MNKCEIFTIEELRNIKEDREMLEFINELENNKEETNELLNEALINLNKEDE